MNGASRSIRLRLFVAALVTIVAALGASGIGLVRMFENHVERRLVANMETDVRQLMAGLVVSKSAEVTIERTPSDPAYEQPFSGKYWQVSATDQIVERSRSLWDEDLKLADDALSDGTHVHLISGPQGRQLIAVERGVVIARPSGEISLRFAAARDRAEISVAVADFRTEIIMMLGLVGALLLAAFAVAIGVGLAPLDRLRTDLKRLRLGEARRLDGLYPSEVARLVEDLNQLIDLRERAAEDARRRAGDLAHGLKTPITAIAVIAEELKGRGELSLAREMSDYASTMQRHVERELALARSISAGPNARPINLRPIVDLLVKSLKRLERDNEIDWRVRVDDVAVAADATALTEIMGNLLDNARKWTRNAVDVRATVEGGKLVITVADDGPGVPDDSLPELVTRGRRLDQSAPGSGLGLSIVRDIVEQLGGHLQLSNSNGGGLVATVRLPVEANLFQSNYP